MHTILILLVVAVGQVWWIFRPQRVMVCRKQTHQLPKTKQAQDRSPKCRELTPPALGGGRSADKNRQRVGWEVGMYAGSV